MKCPNCGKEIANDSQFCEYCGTKLVKPRKSFKGLWITLIVLFLIAIVGSSLYYQYERTTAAIEQANRKAEEAWIAQENEIKKRKEAEEKARQAIKAQTKNIENVKAEAEAKKAEAEAKKADAEAKRVAEENEKSRLQAEAKKAAESEAAKKAVEVEATKKAEEARKEVQKVKKAKKETISRTYKDLGLPSGSLWSTQNENGGFYTYEQAVKTFGKNLPSKAQWNELLNYCNWEWDGSGYTIIGTNGNSIYLPASGFEDYQGNITNAGTTGRYWSSSYNETWSAWALGFFRTEKLSIEGNNNRTGKNSVRLVK